MSEAALADEMLVLADGHCLANQALAACGKAVPSRSGLFSQHSALHGTMQAATLETLVNLVAAGYGTTLIPALAAGSRLGSVGLNCVRWPDTLRARSDWPAGQDFRVRRRCGPWRRRFAALFGRSSGAGFDSDGKLSAITFLQIDTGFCPESYTGLRN